MERALFGLIMLKSERFFDTPETCRLETGSPNRLPVLAKLLDKSKYVEMGRY
jgi:hypothetical protein